MQPRQNLADDALSAQDALICEKRELPSLRVIRNATSREFFVLAVGDPPTLHKLGPIRNVVALVDCEVAETTCFGKRAGVNPELVIDEVNDAD
jgi:hypothetical protein